ncbi:hypothetical protein C8R46DRAFT_1262336 [Mycena filopes]|nr:hypothetical protein C8R46DRAFT_1262336 [Mycena filopes]
MHRPAEDGPTHSHCVPRLRRFYLRLRRTPLHQHLARPIGLRARPPPRDPPETKSRIAHPHPRLATGAEHQHSLLPDILTSLAPSTSGLAQYTRANFPHTFTSPPPPLRVPPPPRPPVKLHRIYTEEALLIDSARLHPAPGLRCSPRRAARHLRKDASDIAILTPIAAAHPRPPKHIRFTHHLKARGRSESLLAYWRTWPRRLRSFQKDAGQTTTVRRPLVSGRTGDEGGAMRLAGGDAGKSGCHWALGAG